MEINYLQNNNNLYRENIAGVVINNTTVEPVVLTGNTAVEINHMNTIMLNNVNVNGMTVVGSSWINAIPIPKRTITIKKNMLIICGSVIDDNDLECIDDKQWDVKLNKYDLDNDSKYIADHIIPNLTCNKLKLPEYIIEIIKKYYLQEPYSISKMYEIKKQAAILKQTSEYQTLQQNYMELQQKYILMEQKIEFLLSRALDKKN